MLWNWQLKEWPKFHYDATCIAEQEKLFLLGKSLFRWFSFYIEDHPPGQKILRLRHIYCKLLLLVQAL